MQSSLANTNTPVTHDKEGLAVGKVLGGVLDGGLVNLISTQHGLNLHLLASHHNLLGLAQVTVDENVLVDLQEESMKQECDTVQHCSRAAILHSPACLRVLSCKGPLERRTGC